MEIEALTLTIGDADLDAVFRTQMSANAPLRDLRAEIRSDGIVLRGKYPLMLMAIPFETLWVPSVLDQRLHVRLTRIKIVGLPAGILQGAFMNGLRELTAREAGAHVESDRVILHLDELLQARGLPIRTNLREVEHRLGVLILRASRA